SHRRCPRRRRHARLSRVPHSAGLHSSAVPHAAARCLSWLRVIVLVAITPQQAAPSGQRAPQYQGHRLSTWALGSRRAAAMLLHPSQPSSRVPAPAPRSLQVLAARRKVDRLKPDRLPWARCVVLESLRLRPSAWGMSRRFIDETDLESGLRLPRGTVVAASQWVIHRDARFFADPLSFRRRMALMSTILSPDPGPNLSPWTRQEGTGGGGRRSEGELIQRL